MRHTLRITGGWTTPLLLAPLLFGLLFLAAPVLAQRPSGSLVGDVAARQAGLTRSWYTQIQLDSGRSQLEFLTPFVSHANSFTLFAVEWEKGKLEFSELERNAFGDPIGVEKARENAAAKVEELKGQGFDAKLTTQVVPEISLYATTNRGVLHAIDGETGRTRWVVVVGNPKYPTLQPGVNEEYVAVVNGSTVYVYDRSTGDLEWERRLSGVPGAGAAVSAEKVFVPMASGKVEAFQLTTDKEDDELERKFRAPLVHVSVGQCYVQPTVTPDVCAWPTDRGLMYVVNANKEGMRFRATANDTVLSPITYDPVRKLLLMSSFDGYVYAFSEVTGDQKWRFSASSPIVASPYVIGDAVYVITDKGELYKVDAETGLEEWWMPRVGRFLAASDTRLYCTDKLNRLMVVDAKNGGRLATLSADQLDFVVTNLVTDRIYVGTRSGLLQCLHEPQLTRPVVHVGPGDEAESAQAKADEGDAGGTTTTTPPKSDDPFGTGGSSTADPFGTGGGSSTADPFGTGGAATPPAAGGAPADDPFSNPFE